MGGTEIVIAAFLAAMALVFGAIGFGWWCRGPEVTMWEERTERYKAEAESAEAAKRRAQRGQNAIQEASEAELKSLALARGSDRLRALDQLMRDRAGNLVTVAEAEGTAGQDEGSSEPASGLDSGDGGDGPPGDAAG